MSWRQGELLLCQTFGNQKYSVVILKTLTQQTYKAHKIILLLKAISAKLRFKSAVPCDAKIQVKNINVWKNKQ
jgi:hypothetical protein